LRASRLALLNVEGLQKRFGGITALTDYHIVVWTNNSMDFTKALSKFYKQRFEALGGEIVLEDFFMMGDKDFSAQVARLKNAPPQLDAVFISAIPCESGLTVKPIRETGLRLPIVSGDGFDTELVTTIPSSQLADEVYFSTHTYREDNRLSASGSKFVFFEFRQGIKSVPPGDALVEQGA
jgi:ABC-type branched-subunit amino acid transport system substrate-binding protein